MLIKKLKCKVLTNGAEFIYTIIYHLVITQRGGGGYGYLVDFFNVKRGPKLLEICVITKLMPSDIELFWTAEFWSR